MRLALVTSLVVALLAAAAAAQVGPLVTPPGPPATPPEKKLISNVYEATDIRTVLSELGQSAGVVIVADQTVEGAVTVQFDKVPFEKALPMVLASGGYVCKKMDGYYLVGLPKPDSATFSTFSETRTLRLSYIAADAAAKALAPSFANYVKVLPSTNALSITAPPLLAERIQADLQGLDKPQPHVMLDARIVAVENNDLLNMGVKWDWPTLQAGMTSDSSLHGKGKGPAWPWGVQIGYTTGKEFTNSLMLTLDLMTQNDEATILANPKVLAQDGHEAQIAVNTEEYFQIVTSGIYVQAQLEKIASGTMLKITPNISENGDVTLDIATEVSDVVARGENNLPVVTRRTTKSTVCIEDGGTAVVAGLMEARTRRNNQDVPGMSKIPIIGGLFKDKSDSSTTRQVAVFITARLLPTPGSAAKAVEKKAPVKPPVRLVGAEFKDQLRDSLRRLHEEP